MPSRSEFMLEIIKKMGDFQHKHFRTDVTFEEKKSSLDIVSFVDKECEEMFTQGVQQLFPGDEVMGEESYKPGYDYSQHQKLWIIDPLDGTLMYQRGVPSYGPMIAYVENGIVQCSAIYLPEIDELYYADETGAYRNNESIHVSKTTDISKAIVSGSLRMIRRHIPDDARFVRFCDSIGVHLSSYACAFNITLIAYGGADASVFSPKSGNSWDTVPVGFLIEKAGGKVTNIGSDTWDIFNPFVFFSNGHIHEEFEKFLER